MYEHQGRHSDARRLTRRAIFLAQQAHLPESLYLWQWQLGRLFRAQGDTENAVKAYRQAIHTLNPIRSELLNTHRTPEETFYEKIRPVYLGLAELLLKKAGSSKLEAPSVEQEAGIDSSLTAYSLQLTATRDTMELLKAAELEDFFEDECVTALRKKTTRLDQAPPHTAVLYPIALPDSLALLLTLPDGMTHMTVPVNAETLRETAMQFRRELQSRQHYGFRRHAELLYDWLIRPN